MSKVSDYRSFITLHSLQRFHAGGLYFRDCWPLESTAQAQDERLQDKCMKVSEDVLKNLSVL